MTNEELVAANETMAKGLQLIYSMFRDKTPTELDFIKIMVQVMGAGAKSGALMGTICGLVGLVAAAYCMKREEGADHNSARNDAVVELGGAMRKMMEIARKEETA